MPHRLAHLLALASVSAQLSSCAILDGFSGDEEPERNNTPSNNQSFPGVLRDFEYVENPRTHRGIGQDCIQAVCPVGKTLLGGGGDFGGVDITRSAPIEGTQSWQLCGRASEQLNWSVQAICASTETFITQTTRNESYQEPTSACALAVCPDGMFALSGGMETDTGSLGASRVREEGYTSWNACAQTQPDTDTNITAYAICIGNQHLWRYSPGQGVLVPTGQRPQECRQIKCEAKEQIVSGGLSWSQDVQLTRSKAISQDTWELCIAGPAGGFWELEAMCFPAP